MTETWDEPIDGSPQEWEKWWWGTATNTFGEEAKQLTYAPRMGLINQPRLGKWPVYDLSGQSVVDLGGGPASMLLKAIDGNKLTVVDPCPYPKWVRQRYRHAGIEQFQIEAEDWRDAAFYDEAWIYNVLQHVIDPEAVISTARAQARTLRIFEWLETETNVGHPHSLRSSDLDAWIGGTGQIGMVDENGAVGLAYWGDFEL